jgi:acetolactate synthase-1/2/3 large subunit
VLFSTEDVAAPAAPRIPVIEPDPDQVARAAALLAGADRPVIIAGSERLGRVTPSPHCGRPAEALRIPSSPTAWVAARSRPITPLAFAKARRPGAERGRRGRRDRHPAGLPARVRRVRGRQVCTSWTPRQRRPVETAVSPRRDLQRSSGCPMETARPRRVDRGAAAAEDAGKARDAEAMAAETDPIKPARIYGELRKVWRPTR